MELDFMSVVGVLKSLTLGSVSLAVLVVILTEVVKEFAGLQGKAVRAVALGIGFVLTAVAYGIAEGLIPAAAGPYIEWVFVAVVGGLGGMGLWHLGKRFLSTNDTSDGDLADAVAMAFRDHRFGLSDDVEPSGLVIDGGANPFGVGLDGPAGYIRTAEPDGTTITTRAKNDG